MDNNYEPLLDPGIHDINIDQLNQMFVEPFNNAAQRRLIVERFLIFLSIVQDIGIKCEVWIDGSFVTQKPEPADIDVAVFADPNDVNNLSIGKQNLLMMLFGNNNETKLRYKCDVYFLLNDNTDLRSYWRGWFGFSREEKPKGIARLTITP